MQGEKNPTKGELYEKMTGWSTHTSARHPALCLGDMALWEQGSTTPRQHRMFPHRSVPKQDALTKETQ